MQRKLTKMICAGVMLIMCVGFLYACNNDSSWNGKLYNSINKYMREDFIERNRTYGVHYIMETLDPITNSIIQIPQVENDAPRTRDFIVDNHITYEEIFSEFDDDINFAHEMLIVHMFTDTNSRPIVIKSVKIKDKKLIVKFFVQPAKDGVNDSTVPGQKCFAIKIDKTELNEVEFLKD